MNMHIPQPHSQRAGSAMMTVMIMIFVLTLMAGGFYSFSANSIFRSRQMSDGIRARAIAEAGANRAVSLLMVDGNFGLREDDANFPRTVYSGGAYDVTVVNNADTNTGRALIISTGEYGVAKAVVAVDIRDARRETVTGDTPPTWRDFAIFANGDLGFNGKPTIDGDVHTNNDFDLNGSDSEITGTISAQNESELASMLSTNRIGKWQLIPFPALSDPEFQAQINAARAAGQLTEIFGNKTYKNGEDFNISTNAITIIHGSVNFLGSGTHSVDGIFYVTGSITANGKAVMNLRGALLAGGDILFNGAAGVFSYSASGTGGTGTGGGTGDADADADVQVYAMWQTGAAN